MVYSSEAYQDIFNKILDDSMFGEATPEERIEAMRHKNVCFYRSKIYRIGNMLECEIFPIWNTKTEAVRAKKEHESRAAQKNLNHLNAQKRITRYINHNFTNRDIWGTFGYDKRYAPPPARRARKDFVNFIRRIKRWRKANGLPELRYVYVTEAFDKEGNPIRPHHHIVMSGDMDRDLIESMWQYGGRPQTRRLCPDDMMLTGLAKYLTKGDISRKLWGFSKNLKKPPEPKVSDKRIKKRELEKIAVNRNTAPDVFKKIFRDYVFKDTERDLVIKHSDFVSGAYIYLQMYRAPSKKE